MAFAIAAVTLAATAASACITYGLMIYSLGGSTDVVLTGAQAMRIAMVIGTAAPLLIAPLLTLRISRLAVEAHVARRQLDELAHTDALTGLLNRRGLDRAASERLAAASAAGEPAAALMIDIDRFKILNDRLGHDFGDEALRHVATALRRSGLSDAGLVARYGGDEYVALLTGDDARQARDCAQRTLAYCLGAPVSNSGETARMTVSIGIAAVERAPADFKTLLAIADRALFAAKADGRNRIAAIEGEALETLRQAA